MSNRVVVRDVDALEHFRHHLVSFNQVLSEQLGSIRTHCHELGEVWDDDKYRAYQAALDEVAHGIDNYLTMTTEHETHLLTLIERLRMVLET